MYIGTGLLRCGKGCQLRWVNYLRPNVKRCHISLDEEEMIKMGRELQTELAFNTFSLAFKIRNLAFNEV